MHTISIRSLKYKLGEGCNASRDTNTHEPLYISLFTPNSRKEKMFVQKIQAHVCMRSHTLSPFLSIILKNRNMFF